ncbi:MAG: complex I NDUFA9 subunit family protein [Planctomycetes bacterium]|nr:complex I NDUFA9 subunit family protein [Planctomycetota bacterium]
MSDNAESNNKAPDVAVAEADTAPSHSAPKKGIPVKKPRPVKPQTVAVTGATGFVGRHLCRALTEAGHTVRGIVRSSGPSKETGSQYAAFEADLFTPDTLSAALDGVDACIHLVGIIFEKPDYGQTFERVHVDITQNVVDACRSHGVKRFVHMSALGARDSSPARYHRTKYQAEQIVRASGLDWTIIQPSLIHGPDGEFTDLVAGWARGKKPPFLFMPYFGAGLFGKGREWSIQPVYVQDVAQAFTVALSEPESIGEVYPLGGPETMTWPEMLCAFRDAIPGGPRRKKAVAIPAWYARTVSKFMGGAGLGTFLPFNYDQVMMSQEDSTCNVSRVQAHLGIDPKPFAEALAEYVSTL